MMGAVQENLTVRGQYIMAYAKAGRVASFVARYVPQQSAVQALLLSLSSLLVFAVAYYSHIVTLVILVLVLAAFGLFVGLYAAVKSAIARDWGSCAASVVAVVGASLSIAIFVWLNMIATV